MKFPSYSKELRDNAKATGQFLVTVDFVRPNGKREMSSTGLMTKKQARLIADAWLKVIKQRNGQIRPNPRTR